MAVGSFLFYHACLAFLLAINNTVVYDSFRIINNPFRAGVMAAFLIVAVNLGEHRHRICAFLFNLLANTLFMWLSASIVPYVLTGTPYVDIETKEKGNAKQ
mmetsp:Transcript_11757/g.17957  ORF Transcript_11757/g.17957 Transcript_11757/m.17957 type:complete len:101 (+) Transcript_11757:2-304(+)